MIDEGKLQGDAIPTPEGLPAHVIVSPDTRLPRRLPPGQSRTKKWPVLDAYGAPKVDLTKWRLEVGGLVNQPRTWTWEQFQQLPRVQVFADFHCVTRWSRPGNVWEGVPARELIRQCGGAKPEARYALAYGQDYGWTTNLPLADLRGRAGRCHS